MVQPRTGCRLWVALTLACSLVVVVAESGPAQAQVSSVTGSALGVFADNISIFGGAQPDSGPTPTVTLPPAGSAAPVTATVASTLVQYGPATLFSSGQVTVTTEGTTGATGSVTTTSAITNVNASGQEVFTAASLSSTCTANEAGTTASTTITGGTVITSEGNPNVDGDEVVVPVPANPAPNTIINGAIEGVGDTFRYVFNEQIPNADGSITVTAAHQVLLGPTALGDVFIGRSVCGVATSATPTTTSTTAAPASTTTTTTAASTTTTAAAAGGGVAGGAFGYRTSVGLFGGAPATRGPAPTVTLPAQGSATPITATAATATAQFGPAIIFESGKLDVSTQGTTSPRSVTSSATVQNPGPPPFSATSAASTCTADASGVKGSATIVGGTVVTKTDGDSNPVTTANVPANPTPNFEIKGTLDVVGDSFRWVFNEQIVGSDGSITVNAAHEYLLGPVAVGELIIGQSRCATTATAFVGPAGQGGTPSALTAAEIARTGSTTASLGALGMVLVTWGLLGLVVGGQLLLTGPGSHLGFPARKRRRPHQS